MFLSLSNGNKQPPKSSSSTEDFTLYRSPSTSLSTTTTDYTFPTTHTKSSSESHIKMDAIPRTSLPAEPPKAKPPSNDDYDLADLIAALQLPADSKREQIPIYAWRYMPASLKSMKKRKPLEEEDKETNSVKDGDAGDTKEDSKGDDKAEGSLSPS